MVGAAHAPRASSSTASTDVPPGLYLLLRDPEALDRLRAACRPDFLWEAADERLPLWRLARGDARSLAARLSCDQDIAADGFFSLGMIADFDASLQTFGPSFYRHLFWETGMVGQVLYLEAEAAGARATGIGCFYDDPVHDVLGLRGARVPEPVSLHGRHAGRGCAADDRARICMGGAFDLIWRPSDEDPGDPPERPGETGNPRRCG